MDINTPGKTGAAFNGKLSIIIPAYNEEQKITSTLLDVDCYLRKQNYDYEIIVVVNGSHDKTYEVVEGLKATTVKNLIAMNLQQSGKGNAVKRGILGQASGDIILFMDADNATPVFEIENFFVYFKRGYDVVIGSRYLNRRLVKQRQPLPRVVLSRLSNMLIRLLIIPGIKDTQVGFKAFSRQAALAIFPLVSISRWGFDMEVLAIALARGYKIKETGVLWAEHGNSHLRPEAYFQSLEDLIKIKSNILSGKYNAKDRVRRPGTRARVALRN